MKHSVILLVASILVVLVGIGLLVRFFFFTSPNPQLPERSVTIGDDTFTVEVADTALTRMRGLSNRQSLPENRGMLFVFPRPSSQGFWMKDTYIPLDFVWIREGSVVGVTADVPPVGTAGTSSLQIYRSPEDVDHVLELNAGAAEKAGITVGSPVRYD